MIEVRNLTKKYGDHIAVENLNFTVEEGQIYGFLGPNGAGKSTTMNIITGCLAATSGEVLIDGHDIFKDARAAKSTIGFLPEQPPLYGDMTPHEYLEFVAEMKGVRKKERASHVQVIMEKTGLLDVENRLIRNISKGYKQRVGLAQALLGDPKIIILDEPTVGLDPAQIIEIRGLIKSLAETHTVIFSSHILSEVSEICSRIIIISEGRIIAEDTPENLESHFVATPVLSVSVKGDPDAVRAAIETLSGVTDVQITDGEGGTSEVVLTCEKGADIKEQLALAMLQNGCLIVRLEESRASLEDVFMQLISQPDPTAAVVNTVPSYGEPLEVDAQSLLDGTVASAYDAHEAFDAPSDDADDTAEPNETTDAPEPDEPAETTDAAEPDESVESTENNEPQADQTEGGEDDAGNV